MTSTPTIAPLLNQVAVVTGASRGIGRAIAERLSQDGAAVVVNYAQRADLAEQVVAALIAGGGRALAVQADVGSRHEVEQLIETAVAHFGRLDILVNNAAVSGGGSLAQLDEAGFARIFNVNVRGLLFATQAAVRHFGPAGGRIINLSSVMGNRPRPGGTIYAASKAAVDALTRNLAAELGPRNILVNGVAPGLVETDMQAAIPASMQQTLATTALGRLGQPAEIADVVSFLAGPAARWLTGQTLYVDGGLR